MARLAKGKVAASVVTKMDRIIVLMTLQTEKNETGWYSKQKQGQKSIEYLRNQWRVQHVNELQNFMRNAKGNREFSSLSTRITPVIDADAKECMEKEEKAINKGIIECMFSSVNAR
eukprot:jgi/Bigna1/143723/aug1.81_g18431